MTTQLPFGGDELKTMCEELDEVGFDWRTMLRVFHNDQAQSIARSKEARKNDYLTTDCPKDFAIGVSLGIARVTIRDQDFVNALRRISTRKFLSAKIPALETYDAMALEVALNDYHLHFAKNDMAAFAVHRRAPAWVEVYTARSLDQLDEACCLGIDRFHLDGIENFVFNEAYCLNLAAFFSEDKQAAGIYVSAHKDYVFARTAGGGVALKRSLLSAANPLFGLREASYPVETERMMTDCTPFIITYDATWGQFLLGKIEPATGSHTADFLTKFRAIYKIEPADNPGGVVCCRRE